MVDCTWSGLGQLFRLRVLPVLNNGTELLFSPQSTMVIEKENQYSVYIW